MPFYMTSIEFKARDDDHAKEVMKALRDKDKTQTALIDAVKANL